MRWRDVRPLVWPQAPGEACLAPTGIWPRQILLIPVMPTHSPRSGLRAVVAANSFAFSDLAAATSLIS
jgi:hypothetical protein